MTIADQKNKYNLMLKDDYRVKYKKNTALQQLFNSKKNEEWTFYMSLKRQMYKKQEMKKLGFSKQAASISNKKETKILEKEAKLKRIKNKQMVMQLGVKEMGSVHIEKYTKELKSLIGTLNDESLNKTGEKIHNDIIE